MSIEEEATILAPFHKRSAKDEIIEGKEIKAEYQATVASQSALRKYTMFCRTR